jgi:hypothetical protein
MAGGCPSKIFFTPFFVAVALSILFENKEGCGASNVTGCSSLSVRLYF